MLETENLTKQIECRNQEQINKYIEAKIRTLSTLVIITYIYDHQMPMIENIKIN